MRKKGLLAATAALLIIGFVSAGAAAPTPGVSLPPTPTSALERLIATGELPSDVRGEPGVWNYAGPSCPGPGWNCVALGVLPVTQVGTVNVAECTGANCIGITQIGTVSKVECTVGPSCTGGTQTADYNEFVCKLKSTETVVAAAQSCTWNQTGVENKVLVEQLHEPTDAAAQCVVQTASGTQEGQTNELKVLQDVDHQSTVAAGTPATQTQEARQVVVAGQEATASKNYSDIQQNQDQEMSGHTQVQRQNTGSPPTGCAPLPEDCADQVPPVKEIPNPTTCVDLGQSAPSGGTNLSSLNQRVQSVATSTREGTSASKTEQQQGSPTGGNEGRVHQCIGVAPTSTLPCGPAPDGSSTSDVQQSTQQRLSAPGPEEGRDQQQYEDPECCGWSQDGGEGNVETTDQQVDQQSDPGGFQVSTAAGSSRTSGSTSTCSVTHTLQNNDASASRSVTADPCMFLLVETSCAASGEGGDCDENPPVGICEPPLVFNPETAMCEEEPVITVN